MTDRTDSDREARECQRVEQVMSWPQGVFVFGSNEAGIHGSGAAREAARKYGAVRGVGFGRQARSFAIPTKRTPDEVLSLTDIARNVWKFKRYAREHETVAFAVTRIGCGYAGYTDADIAPMFADAPDNCDLPEGWRDFARAPHPEEDAP